MCAGKEIEDRISGTMKLIIDHLRAMRGFSVLIMAHTDIFISQCLSLFFFFFLSHWLAGLLNIQPDERRLSGLSVTNQYMHNILSPRHTYGMNKLQQYAALGRVRLTRH